jgi:hypothetical protein
MRKYMLWRLNILIKNKSITMKHYLLIPVMCMGIGVQALPYNGEWDLNQASEVKITSGGRYRVYQVSNNIPISKSISISTYDSVYLVIEGLNIQTSSSSDVPPIGIENAKVRLRFAGNNKIVSTGIDNAGIQLSSEPDYASTACIIITADNAADTLKVTGGKNSAGIGTNRKSIAKDITIAGGVVIATGGINGAGIGTGHSDNNYTNYVASINITGGIVYAYGGRYGAGIGTGACISDKDKFPTNTVSHINISGGEITAAAGDDNASPIGTGYVSSTGGTAYNTVDSITISGGIIDASSGKNAAAIGSGNVNANEGKNTSSIVGKINIKGGRINAQGNSFSAGIGSGQGSKGNSMVKLINISGGVVNAQSAVPLAVDIGHGEQGNAQQVYISGGNIKAMKVSSDSINDPKNNNRKSVYLGQMPDRDSIIEVAVDGIPYNISGNHKDDPILYLWMQHDTTGGNLHKDDTHQVQSIRRNNGLLYYRDIATWNETGKFFEFRTATTAISSPTKIKYVIDVNSADTSASDTFFMYYGDKNALKISAEVEGGYVAADFPSIVSADINEAVYKIDETIVKRKKISQAGQWPGPNTGFQSLKVFIKDNEETNETLYDFKVGTHTFSFEYGGTSNYFPCKFVTTLIIRKSTPEPPSPLDNLTAEYGDKLNSIPLPAGYAWEKPDSTINEAGGMQYKSIYCPDTTNYYPVEILQNVIVRKAKPNCKDNALDGITGEYGKTLSSIELPAPWLWISPTTKMANVGERVYGVIADTTKYTNTASGCVARVFVQSSTAVQLLKTTQKLEAHPNPIESGGTLIVLLPEDNSAETIEMYNMQGALVQQFSINANRIGSSIELRLDIVHGMYIIKAGKAATTILVI